MVGASGGEVAALLPAGVHVVHNSDYGSGMGSSLRLGLSALSAAAGLVSPDDADDVYQRHNQATADGSIGPCDAVLVHLVDLPGVGDAVVRRLLLAAGSAFESRTALRRAAYGRAVGHPVLIGRAHWAGVVEVAAGDLGAREYFRDHAPTSIECGDIGTGADVDIPPDD